MHDHISLRLSSKFVGLYTKLLQGYPPHMRPNDASEEFWDNLLAMDLEREWLINRLGHVTKEDCLGYLKPTLNALFSICVKHARNALYSDPRKSHSLETLAVFTKLILSLNLAGWEVMEIFAGGVNQSDKFFMELVTMINDLASDSNASSSLRHQTMQFAIIFICGINQLSPGAYFLRLDLFPTVVAFVKSPDTEHFTFEAVLFLAILANFHKSDAAKLNPYLQRIHATEDKDLLRKVCWASNFAADSAVKAYQAVVDDSPPTLVATFGSVIASFRPDRALSVKPVDPPREVFKNQPIEACVILLPIFEFSRTNNNFLSVLLEPITDPDGNTQASRLQPMPFTILTLSSYLATHASSSSSSRAIAYAHLSLHILLAFSENDMVMDVFCRPTENPIWLCRQRLPFLPITTKPRAPVCALLDCCVLWLRHNLHKRLEVSSFMTSVEICHRVLWYLQDRRIRLDYEWQELWRALLGLLDFLSNKLDSLVSTGGVEQLAGQVLAVLDMSICASDFFLLTRAVHEFIYELVRSSTTLKKQGPLLQTLALPQAVTEKIIVTFSDRPKDTLARVLNVTQFYEDAVRKSGARSAEDAMRIVAQEIEQDGLQCVKGSEPGVPLAKHSENIVGFVRYACTDGLSLMP